jgi:pimeloyl-ACP methyl ester carboxylesterase
VIRDSSLCLLPRRLLVALVLALLQAGCVSSLVYFPDPVVRPIPEQVGLSPEWAFFQAEDGVRLSAWYLPRADARGTVLFLHGNGGNVSHYVPSLALFNRLGYSSLILDYRGYGRSEGAPSEQGTYRDARAAWQHLVQTRRIPPDAIVVWGRSLGGAIAAWLARERNPRLLVLESAFTALRDVAEHLYPWAPTRLLGDRYPTEAFLREVRAPVLVIHSPDDELAPYAHGVRLLERASPPKRFLRIRGRHNTPQYDGLTPELLDPRTWGATAAR